MKITSGYRTIKNGQEFDHLFPPANHRDKIILKNGEVQDTVGLMGEIVRQTLSQTQNLAVGLKGKSLSETCRRVWEFLYNHIQYKLDKRGLEQLRQPARSWADRHSGIDCDCFSVFTSSILSNLGIEHKFRITKYAGKSNFQHVYVVVPDGHSEIVIDCVLSKFNYEKPYSEKKDFTMKPTKNGLGGIDIAMLSGVPRSLGEVIDDVRNKVHFQQIACSDKATFAYLQDLRLVLSHKPQLCSDPQTTLKMLDYLIKYWNTPYRNRALDNLCKDEAVLDGLGDFGKLFKKIKAKRTEKKVAKIAKKAVKKQAKVAKKVAKRQAKVAKKQIKVEKKAVRKQAKVAKKVARQEAKTVRKVAKQERKVAKQQAKTTRKVARQATKQARVVSRVEKRAVRQDNRTARVALRKGSQTLPKPNLEVEQDEVMTQEPMMYEAEIQTPASPITPTASTPLPATSATSEYPEDGEQWDEDNYSDETTDETEDWNDEDETEEHFDEDENETDYDMEESVEGLFKRNPQKKAQRQAKKQAKKQVRAEKKAAKKADKARIKALPPKERLKARIKKVGKAIVKFNPLTTASRGGVLVAMKLNIGKMASKLKWGYATQADVNAGKLTQAQWEASKKALSKTESIFEKIGGDKAKLKIAILYGRGGTSSLKGGELGLCDMGLGAVATGAAVAAAIPVIASIVNALKDAGIMKADEAEAAMSLINNPNTQKELETGVDAEITSGGGESFFQRNKTALLVGGAVAVGGLALYLTSRKKPSKASKGGLSGAKTSTPRKPKTITLS